MQPWYKKNKDAVSLYCCNINAEFTQGHFGTFTVSTSSLSTDESMKTSLKWGHPCWLLSAFSCSLLSWEFRSEHPSVSVWSSSSSDSEWLSGTFSAQGGLITGLTLILRPFTTPHVNTAVISKSLSLALTLSTWKEKSISKRGHLGMVCGMNYCILTPLIWEYLIENQDGRSIRVLRQTFKHLQVQPATHPPVRHVHHDHHWQRKRKYLVLLLLTNLIHKWNTKQQLGSTSKRDYLKEIFIILMSASLTVFQGSTSKDFSSWCLVKQGISTHIYVEKKYSKKTNKTNLPFHFGYSGQTRSVE